VFAHRIVAFFSMGVLHTPLRKAHIVRFNPCYARGRQTLNVICAVGADVKQMFTQRKRRFVWEFYTIKNEKILLSFI
jgi:hypothetical protein